METGIYGIGAAIITAIVAGIGIWKASKKEKEDINIARTGQAIESWQELAESNKGHWDKCEARVEELQVKTENQQVQLNEQAKLMLKMQSEIYTLQLQVHGRITLDAKRDSSDNPDGV